MEVRSPSAARVGWAPIATGGPRLHELFISHAAADRAWVEGYLADAMNGAGINWHSEATFARGVARLADFDRAIRESRRVVLVLSPAYLADGYTRFIDLMTGHYGAERATWPVTTIMLQPVVVPERLAGLPTLDATQAAAWPALVNGLSTEFGRRVPGPAIRPPCPYPGLLPFAEKDAPAFHGREAEIQTLLQHLRQGRLLFVVGPSGAGKSSLIQAGLLPRLARSPYWPANFWQVRTLRPGPAPLQTLARAVEGGPPAGRLLLVIDPFEEIFTLAGLDEQARFFAALQQLRGDPRRMVLGVLRADFYPHLMDSPLWPLGDAERLEISSLRGDGLRQAIGLPATEAGVYLEAALVDRLLADAVRPDGLPLLQETLVLLWSAMQRRLITLDAYQHLARLGPEGLAVALAARGSTVLGGLPPVARTLARRIFLRLAQPGPLVTAAGQPIGDLRPADADPILFDKTVQYLVANRLLRVAGGEGGEVREVYLAHEVLLRRWPILEQWLAERQAADEIRRRLDGAARGWVQGGRSLAGLLAAPELQEAQRWLAGPDHLDQGASPAVLELVEASQAALAAAQQQQDAAQQQEIAARQQQLALAEAARQQQLAAVEAQAATIAQTAEDLRRRVGEVTAALTATQEQTRTLGAQLSATRSRWAAALAAIAAAQRDRDPELGVLLAREAIAVTRRHGEPILPQAEDALHQTILWSHVRLTLRGHSGEVLYAAYSPDGQLIVTAGADGTARVWNAKTGEALHTLAGHSEQVTGAAWSPAARFLVTTSDDKTAKIWYAGNGQERLTLRGHTFGVMGAAYSPDGLSIVTVSRDGSARLWDSSTGQELRTFKGHTSYVYSAAWSADGRSIVTVSADKTAKVWDAADGEERLTLRTRTGGLWAGAWSPDGTALATASRDGTAEIWDVKTGRSQLTLKGHTDEVVAVAYSPDGHFLITAAWDGTAKIWEVATGQEHLTLRGHAGRVLAAGWSPDGRTAVTASADGTAKVWDTAPRQARLTLAGHEDAVLSAAYSPDRSRIVTAGADRLAKIWDTSTGQVVRTLAGHTDAVRSAAYSPDGLRIATAGKDATARLWDAASGAEILTLQGHTGGLWGAAWSPDGRCLVTASADKTAKIWDTQSGAEYLTLGGRTDWVRSAAWSPDGRRIVTANLDETARIWDAVTGEELAVLSGHSGTVNSALYSADGRFVVTASGDNTARVWDASTGEEGLVLSGHKGYVISAVISPDGHSIVTASGDRTAKVWDSATGHERLTLHGHTDVLHGATYSPDGRFIITAGADGTAREYAVGIEDLLDLATTRVTRTLTPGERATYLGDSADEGVGAGGWGLGVGGWGSGTDAPIADDPVRNLQSDEGVGVGGWGSGNDAPIADAVRNLQSDEGVGVGGWESGNDAPIADAVRNPKSAIQNPQSDEGLGVGGWGSGNDAPIADDPVLNPQSKIQNPKSAKEQ